MGLLNEKIKKSYKKRKLDEMKHFYDINKGLRESMVDINKTLDNFESFDELLNLQDESPEDENLIKEKEIKEEFNKCKVFFDYFGVIFCISHLIGVQSSIIILNSLFSEIVEEFKLMINDTPREYNFYEKIQINSYRELPEIDVGMITSSVGIIFLKNYGFNCSNITFQFSSLIWLFLLFLFFDFHINDELLKNYSGWKIFVLIVSYIFLSFIVGCSSTISLKEYFDFYSGVFFKSKNREKIEKTFFYTFSGISAFLIILINRKIFTSFKDIESKKVLISIEIVGLASFFLSMIFHCLYLIPLRNKKEKKKEEENKGALNENEDVKDENPRRKKGNKEQIENINIYGKNKLIKDEEIKSNALSGEDLIIKFNQSFPQNNNQLNEICVKEINISKKIYKKKHHLYSTKICTLCGYIYLRKETGNKKACICYYYTDKCTWFKEKIFNVDVIVPVFTELFCQINNVGYNSILTEKLLNDYSYSKNIKFYITLFIFSLIFGISYSSVYSHSLKETEEKEKKSKGNKIFDYLSLISFVLFGFTLFTFISSIYYYKEDNIHKKRWDNIIMAECIYFKVIDLMILSFFDFFDNTDIFNTTLAITVEKFIWMIIEVLIDNFVSNKKNLILIQIIITSISIGIFIIIFCCNYVSKIIK